MSNPIYVSTEELPVSFRDPTPHGNADRRVLIIKDDLAAELETLAKSLNQFTLRDALRWLDEQNAQYRIKPDAPTPPTTSATPAPHHRIRQNPSQHLPPACKVPQMPDSAAPSPPNLQDPVTLLLINGTTVEQAESFCVTRGMNPRSSKRKRSTGTIKQPR